MSDIVTINPTLNHFIAVALSLDKPRLDNLAGDIWKSAERLRGKFKAYEYQGVILPIIVIRRLECVLLAWREAKRAEVLAKRPNLKERELVASSSLIIRRPLRHVQTKLI